MSRSAVEIRRPVPDDLEHLARNLRDQDLAELRASGRGADPLAALRQSVAVSRWSRVALVDEAPIAVFGCGEYGSLLAPIGVPWLMGTGAIVRHGRVLQREARRYIAAMLQQYPRLFNAVHAENTVSVRWLRHLGFTLHPAVPAPPHGALFHAFEMTRDV
jgi:hypothetical protein